VGGNGKNVYLWIIFFIFTMNNVLMKNIIGVLNKIFKEKLDALDKRVILRNYHGVNNNPWKKLRCLFQRP
jgi:hypothetical protein